MVLGASGTDGESGAVLIFPGSEDAITRCCIIAAGEGEFGAALAAADIEGDGIDELAAAGASDRPIVSNCPRRGS